MFRAAILGLMATAFEHAGGAFADASVGAYRAATILHDFADERLTGIVLAFIGEEEEEEEETS